jgi:serine/threonine protein kinase
MVREIQVQRQLRNCGNTIKLFKIYESEKYINLLMEYQEGGTLGDLLEKDHRFTEDEARMITA